MKASQILDKYISFFEKHGHKRIANSPLVPQNDPTTLFTSSGMQPLVPYLLGETHPQGTRLVNVQNCFRAQDIEEIGDNRHTTFFRMLGNWSLGDYFKKEQLPWFFEFLTQELKLDPDRLYVTVFDGDENFKAIENGKLQALTPDVEAYSIWAKLFNIETDKKTKKEKIRYYGPEKNWWSRSGTPDKMPVGEPGGPDSEVFYDFGAELKIHESSNFKNECHPNCDCGRFVEIGNSVFMQYKKVDETTFEELPNKNVDFGGGLERLVAATENQPDIFMTSLYSESIRSLQALTKNDITYTLNPKPYRIIVDHLNAATFMVSNGVIPSNKGQGYILRRLIRRAMVQARKLGMYGDEWLSNIGPLLEIENNVDGSLKMDTQDITVIITQEVNKFRKTIEGGLKEIKKVFNRAFGGIDPDNLPQNMKLQNNTFRINGKEIFKIYETYGLPIEIAQEIMTEWGVAFDQQTIQEAKNAMKQHQDLSRKGAEHKFKGGLADHQERTIMGHTATHLLHQALRDVLGHHVHQTGSNITTERLRFDFNHDAKLTDEQVKQVEDIINEKIKANLPVHFEMIPTTEAKAMGAIGLFEDTYQETSKIYFIGGDSKNPKDAYSIEFCGGPHVDFTGTLKSVKIIKQENIGNKQRRLYATVAE